MDKVCRVQEFSPGGWNIGYGGMEACIGIRSRTALISRQLVPWSG